MLEIRDVSVAYGTQEIVHRASLSVLPNQTVSIVGESGSGKSTLLKAITGLLGVGGRVTGGRVLFEGRDLTALPEDDMRKLRGARIATVYQQAGHSMDPVTKIGSQFYEALSTVERVSRSESDRRAIECMCQLSLKEPERILRSYPVTLSGGTNQRVALALAMVMNPKLILADEPTSALDVTVQVQVVEAMRRLKANCSAGILMVTHNIGVVAQMSDYVAVMYDGWLVEQGAAAQVLGHPAHPYTAMLMNSVLRMDGTLPEARAVHRADAGRGCPFYGRCLRAEKICAEALPEVQTLPDDHRAMCHLAKEAAHD